MPRALSAAAQRGNASEGRDAVILQRLGTIDATLGRLSEAVTDLVRVETNQENLTREVGRIAELVDKTVLRVEALERENVGDERVDNHKRDRWMYWSGVVMVMASVALVGVEFWNGHQETIQHIDAQPALIVEQPGSPQPHREATPEAVKPGAPSPAIHNPDK